MLGVGLDRFDYEIQAIGTVDLAGDAVGLTRLHANGLGEVMEPIDALRVAIKDEQHRAGAMLRPLKQEQMIGAEVEHKRAKSEGFAKKPSPIVSAVEGLPGRLLGDGISHSAAHAGLLANHYERDCCCRCLR